MKKLFFLRKGRSQNQSDPPKQTKTVDPILKTYWTSLISLMLCVTMFLGTTAAWFSDEVTTSDNRVDVGTLSVKLEYRKKDEDYQTLAGSSQNKSTQRIFDQDVPWAPGYTAVREILVTNEGTLNLRYIFTFQEGASDGSAELQWNDELAKCFEVYVKDNSTLDDTLPSSYSELVAAWTPVRTLDGKVADLAQIVSQRLTVGTSAVKHKAPDAADAAYPSHSFLIALHMKEEATLNMSGKKLPLGAYLVAYQGATDEDDLGSTNPILFVQNAVDLVKAVTDDSNEYNSIVLCADIELERSLTIDKYMQLDLNGHTLTLKKTADDEENTGSLIVSGNGKLVVSDRCVVGNASEPGAINPQGIIDVQAGELLVNGGKLQHVQVSGGTMTMNGGVVEETTSYSNGITLNGTSTLVLNYGLLNVSDSGYSVYAASGTGTVTVADTFHFKVGSDNEARYGKAEGATLTVNSEAK